MRKTLLAKYIVLAVAMFALAVALVPRTAIAQSENLLKNPGFEEGYSNQGNVVELAVPNDWTLHWVDNLEFPGSQSVARRPETVVWNIQDAPDSERDLFWRDGIYNLKLFKGLEPMYSGLSQDLQLEAGARYRFIVPIYPDIVAGYDGGQKIAPYQENAAGVRLGASPVGAPWRDENRINYSGWWTNSNKANFYFNMNDYAFDFVATSGQMTVWVEMYGTLILPYISNNGFFIDGLSLRKIGNAIPPTQVWPTPTPTRPWPTPTATKPWPTRTPTPRIWPTKTPVPTNTPAPTSTTAPTLTPTVTSTPTNTPYPTNTPTNTPTPLPTGPWFASRNTPVPTGAWFPSATPGPATPLPVDAGAGAAADAAASSDSDSGAVAVVVPVQPPASNSGSNNFLPPTSTPDANGEIFSVVGQGDSVWSIAAKAGLTLDQILELNGFPKDQAVFVKLGDRLKVGQADAAPAVVEEPAAETTSEETAETTSEEGSTGAAEGASEEVAQVEEPTAVPEPTQPPAPAQPLGAEICLKSYEDSNNNAAHDAGEPLMANVAFTILQGDAVKTNYISDGQTAAHCIKNLDAGAYRITRSKLPNEVLTTGGELAIALTDGASVEVAFGSYLSDSAEIQQQSETDTSAVSEVLSTATPVTIDTTQAETTSSPRNTILTAVAIAAVLLLLAIIIIILSRRSA